MAKINPIKGEEKGKNDCQMKQTIPGPIYIPSSKSCYVLLKYTSAVYGKPPTSQKEVTSLRKREEGRAHQRYKYTKARRKPLPFPRPH